MVNYWNNFVSYFEKLGRDATDIFKRKFAAFSNNVETEGWRMEEDLSNRISTEVAQGPSVPNENKKTFLELMETVDKIVDHLQNINTLCSPIDGEPHVNPGSHGTDVAELNKNRELIRIQGNSFRQLVADDNGEGTLQLKFLSQMDTILQGKVFRTICLELQNVVDQGKSDRVKQYGEMSGELLQQIEEFKKAQREREETIEAEIEWKEIEEEQEKQFQLFLEKQSALIIEHMSVKRELSQANRVLQLENVTMRREQMSRENERRNEIIDTNVLQVLRITDVENAKRIIAQVEDTSLPFLSVRESLENIRTLCIRASDCHDFNFSLGMDTENIQIQTNTFTTRVKVFKQYLQNTFTSDEDLLKTFFDLLGNMKNLVSHRDINEICTKLPIMVRNKNEKEITKYGKIAGTYYDKFSEVNRKLDESLQRFNITYTHANNPYYAIGQNSLEPNLLKLIQK